MRFIRTNASPTYYNQILTPSTGLDGNYIHYYGNFHGTKGYVPHKTEKDPTKFEYTNNLFKLDMFEWRSRGADYFYQIFKGLHRSNDTYTRLLMGYTGFTYLMAHQALYWKLHVFFFTCFTVSRIRDRAVEPVMDEVLVLDTIFKNE